MNPIQTLERRFWAKVIKTAGCWIWVGAKTGATVDPGAAHMRLLFIPYIFSDKPKAFLAREPLTCPGIGRPFLHDVLARFAPCIGFVSHRLPAQIRQHTGGNSIHLQPSFRGADRCPPEFHSWRITSCSCLKLLLTGTPALNELPRPPYLPAPLVVVSIRPPANRPTVKNSHNFIFVVVINDPRLARHAIISPVSGCGYRYGGSAWVSPRNLSSRSS